MQHAHAWNEGGWSHTQEGRLLRESGWMAHHDHIAIDGTDALAIYAPPREFTYDDPGSPDDCQSTDPVPAQELTERVFFDLDAADVARPPGAHASYDTVIMDGIVLLRLPLARLGAGTTDIAAANLSGADSDVEWRLRIGVELRSAPGHPRATTSPGAQPRTDGERLAFGVASLMNAHAVT